MARMFESSCHKGFCCLRGEIHLATSSIFTDIVIEDKEDITRLVKALKSSRRAYKRAKIKRFFRKILIRNSDKTRV